MKTQLSVNVSFFLNTELYFVKKPPYTAFFQCCCFLHLNRIQRLAAFNSPQKMKFSIKDFFGKCDQIRSFNFLCYVNSRGVLGPYNVYMMRLFAKIVNSKKPLTLFAKSLHHRRLIGSQIRLWFSYPLRMWEYPEEKNLSQVLNRVIAWSFNNFCICLIPACIYLLKVNNTNTRKGVKYFQS